MRSRQSLPDSRRRRSAAACGALLLACAGLAQAQELTPRAYWPMRLTWLFELEAGVWLFGDNDDFLGATLVFPIKGRHALRTSISTGAVTESGGDYEIFTLSYLYAW